MPDEPSTEQPEESSWLGADWETLDVLHWSIVRGQPFKHRSGRFETSESWGLRVAWEQQDKYSSTPAVEFAVHLSAGSTGMDRYKNAIDRASHIELAFELLGIGSMGHGLRYKVGGGFNLGRIWWRYRQPPLDGKHPVRRQDELSYIGFSVPLGLEWQWRYIRAEWFVIPAILLLDDATDEGYENDMRQVQFRTKSNLSLGVVF
ncbi:MAG: hypothetical protein LAT63_02395 [Marinobacter sp.]|nr:hypothetical protein [Marinobacter sp.]